LEETDDADRELNLRQMCTHMPRKIRIEDAKMKKNVEENKIKYPRKLRTHSRNKNAIEILKDKLRKSTRMWRKQEFRNERRKLRNRGNRWERIKENSGKFFPTAKHKFPD